MEKFNAERSWVRGSCIGKGSFGSVSLAVDLSDGEVFAVKSVDRNSSSPAQVEAIENEIRILRSISSPYVVGYLGDGWTSEFPSASYRNMYLEYLPGGTVADLAKRSDGDVDEETVRRYTWCIVSALRYVHSKGIVHCDVKGKNVLVGPANGAVKLADFGSATEFNDRKYPRGSPLWMAPEVVQGGYQGPESDVWSLGCTVIEMITGKPAWEDRGADTLFEIGYSGKLPEFPTHLPEHGRDFLEKCLQRDPCKRWNCDQLLRHPFISSSSPDDTNTDSTPRCVIDWFSSESGEDSDADASCETEDFNENAKQRISELATNSGANWESDGWMLVRNLITESEPASGACCSADDEEGINSEYPQLMGTEEESIGVISVNSDSTARIKTEYYGSTLQAKPEHKNGVVFRRRRDSVGASWRCQDGWWTDRKSTVESREKGIYSCSELILYLILYFYHHFIINFQSLYIQSFTFYDTKK